MIETIKIPNENKSFAVMYPIGNAPFRGVWVSGGDRCETATPTEAAAETDLTAYRCRLPLRVITHRLYFTQFLLVCQFKINIFTL